MNKIEKFTNGLLSWEGIILMILAFMTLSLMGCSTKWEQSVGDYKATAHWGVEFEEKEDE